MSARVVGDNGGWAALRAAAGTGIAAIQPVHVAAVIVPDAEYQYHAVCQSLAHGCETTVG